MQFTPTVDDALVLARDVAGDGASKLADKVNPDEERLNKIDEPAEDNTWHEAPDFKGMKDQAMSKVKKAKAENEGPAQDAVESAKGDAQNQNSNRDAASAAASNVKNQISANVDDDTKDKVKGQKDKAVEQTKGYLKEKMPKERRDQTIWRLKKMIVEIQGHEDCES